MEDMNQVYKKKKEHRENSVFFSGQQEVEHVEEHLVIIGCTNNVPAPSLFSNSSEVEDELEKREGAGTLFVQPIIIEKTSKRTKRK